MSDKTKDNYENLVILDIEDAYEAAEKMMLIVNIEESNYSSRQKNNFEKAQYTYDGGSMNDDKYIDNNLEYV